MNDEVEKLKIVVGFIGVIAGITVGIVSIVLWILDYRAGGNPSTWQMVSLVIIGWGYSIIGSGALKRKLRG